MRRFVPVFITLTATSTFGDFSVDVGRTQTLKEMSVFTLNDLGVGESGFVQLFFGLCKLSNGNVGMDRYTEIESEKSEYGTYLKIKRLPKEKVSIVAQDPNIKAIAGIRIPIGSKKKDTLKGIAKSLAKLETCNEDYFIVESIENAKSLSELLEIIISKTSSSESVKKLHEDTEKPESSEPVSTWMVHEDKSKIDDSTNITLTLDSNEKHSDYSRLSRRTILVIRCRENKTEAFVNTNRTLDSETATIRLDSEKAYPLQMLKSKGGRALFFSNPIKKIRKIWEHEKMIFRFTPYNSGEITVTFNIDGLKTRIAPLRKACHW